MNAKKIFGVVALGLCGMFAASSASAALAIKDCADTPGAIANGTDPTLCAGGDASGSPSDQNDLVDAVFPGNFTFGGKVEAGGAVTPGAGDFVLTLGPGDSDWDFSFNFSSASLVGQTIAFVLLVKQGNNDAAYYWNSLVLDIDGFYNSFNITPGGPGEPDFSHVSAFYRIVDAPEPGTLALLALGLLAVGFARRRTTSR